MYIYIYVDVPGLAKSPKYWTLAQHARYMGHDILSSQMAVVDMFFCMRMYIYISIYICAYTYVYMSYGGCFWGQLAGAGHRGAAARQGLERGGAGRAPQRSAPGPAGSCCTAPLRAPLKDL